MEDNGFNEVKLELLKMGETEGDLLSFSLYDTLEGIKETLEKTLKVQRLQEVTFIRDEEDGTIVSSQALVGSIVAFLTQGRCHITLDTEYETTQVRVFSYS